MTREQLEADKRARVEDDLRTFMSKPQGRRVYWRLLEQAGINRPSFNESALAMAFAEGRRSFALDLGAEVQRVCPDFHLLAVHEAVEDAAHESMRLKQLEAEEAKARDDEA